MTEATSPQDGAPSVSSAALIAFRVLDETVEIVAILYGGRDLRATLVGR